MVLEKGQGVRETARKLGISRATLAGWMREIGEHEEAFPGSGNR
jgi:transposase-like protein